MSIIVENLSHIYMPGTPFERAALKDINLKIDKGEFVGIIGHTGSGKSTLIQHFNGILKPTAGRVQVNGIDTSQKNLKEMRRSVGLVFQYPEHQLFEETVYDDIAFGLIKRNEMSDHEIRQEVLKACETVGLDQDILEKSPFELSGGQKRRVAIAGVIVMEPKILILDEPTAGLDPRGRDEMYGFIKDMHTNLGITIILVSHSMEDVAKMVERVIVMSKAKVDMDGPVIDVFKETQHLEEIGLSAPQITYLIKILKKNIPDLREDVFTVKDAKDEILKHLRRQTDLL